MIFEKRRLCAIIVALMLLTQLGIAQHSTVHFLDHVHYAKITDKGVDSHAHHHADEHHDDDGQSGSLTEEFCDLCLIVKSLSVAISWVQTDLNWAFGAYSFFDADDSAVIRSEVYYAYNSRAPPTFLI